MKYLVAGLLLSIFNRLDMKNFTVDNCIFSGILILTALFFSSCGVLQLSEIKGSLDGYKQRYSGRYYPRASPTKEDVGFNVGATILISPGKTPYSTRKHSPEENLMGPKLLYASTNPEFLLDETPKSTPDFLKNMEYQMVPQYIKKRTKDGGSKVGADYIQLPILALYKYKLNPAGTIYAGLGPYFAYGIGGRIKTSFGDKINTFDKENGLKRFDAGISIAGGYKMTDGFSFTLSYDIGLINISRNAPDEKVKTRMISLNVGYPLTKLIGLK
jgi:hypothetical protein